MLPAGFVAANNLGAQLHQVGDYHGEMRSWLKGYVQIANGLLERRGVQNAVDRRAGKLPAEAFGGFEMQAPVYQFIGVATPRDGPAREGADGSADYKIGAEDAGQRFPCPGLVSAIHATGGKDQRRHLFRPRSHECERSTQECVRHVNRSASRRLCRDTRSLPGPRISWDYRVD